jgi:V/A-type H+-transporting ATPase subunit D
MARLALSKSSLSQQNRQLKTFERFLPSLDLKRRQLIAERARAQRAIDQTEATIGQLRREVMQKLPMASNEEVRLDGLVTTSAVRLDEENIMGVRLPLLQDADIKLADYALLGKPEWVDNLAEHVVRMVRMQLRVQVEQRRLQLLEAAVRTITQRVNLFDKVLIPRTRDNIRRIQIFLADNERAAVVRAKIAKGKRAREQAA